MESLLSRTPIFCFRFDGCNGLRKSSGELIDSTGVKDGQVDVSRKTTLLLRRVGVHSKHPVMTVELTNSAGRACKRSAPSARIKGVRPMPLKVSRYSASGPTIGCRERKHVSSPNPF